MRTEHIFCNWKLQQNLMWGFMWVKLVWDHSNFPNDQSKVVLLLFFVRLWFHVWCLFCPYLYHISPFFCVPREGCALWFLHFLGILTHIFVYCWTVRRRKWPVIHFQGFCVLGWAWGGVDGNTVSSEKGPSEKGPTVKAKNLLHIGANSFLLQ